MKPRVVRLSATILVAVLLAGCASGRRKCRFVARGGRLTAARNCSKPLWLKAKGTASWSLDSARPLPRGSYSLQVRARDAAGNLQRAPARRTVRVR